MGKLPGAFGSVSQPAAPPPAATIIDPSSATNWNDKLALAKALLARNTAAFKAGQPIQHVPAKDVPTGNFGVFNLFDPGEALLNKLGMRGYGAALLDNAGMKNNFFASVPKYGPVKQTKKIIGG